MPQNEWLETIDSLIASETHPLSNLANAAAYIYGSMEGLNWAGFYMLHEGTLWLGPFQGKVACTRIGLAKGVCGAAFSRDEIVVVPDVHAFPGHIACDAASQSEIVLPLRQGGRPVGVLDLDSPFLNRFTQSDRDMLARVAELLSSRCDFERLGYDLKR